MPKTDYEYGTQKKMNQIFIDRIKQNEREASKMEDDLLSRLGSIGISAGISGAILGTGGAALGGVRGLSKLAKAGLLGALGSAGLAGGANLAGSIIEPNAEDFTANTRRGAYGGLLAGGLTGGAIGALAAAGKGRALLSTSIGRKIARAIPTDNIFSDYIRRVGARSIPKTAKMTAGGTVGGLVGAGTGAFVGSDEGMQYDVIMEEARRRGLLS